MWNLAWLVLDDEARLDEVLAAWEQVGVRGATILESTGMARQRGYLNDDLPLFPSISTLMKSTKDFNFTLFTLLDERLTPEALLAATESVIGDLSQPNTGVFFALPLSLVKGPAQQPT